jgi:1,2-diacylglycerol 3-beta-glucosyltransferase
VNAEIMRLTDIALASASLPPLAAAAYLAGLTVLSTAPRHGPRVASSCPFFDVIVPAHDEESQIADTVTNLLALTYPRDAFRVVVVADNCTDATALRAKAAGAEVLERHDHEHHGKGYALARAFEWSLAERRADAVVVVDADTIVTANLLEAFAAQLERGVEAMQADYRVRNADASWRTRLMVVALAAFHGLRSRARERLGVSCGLRGNGMALSSRLLRMVPYAAFSIVEDVEYGIRLGEAGHRVAYVDTAAVMGAMPVTERASRTQRRRWEAGRRQLARTHAWQLILRGVRERSKLLADLGIDLAIPPIARLTMWTALGLAASATLALLATGITPFAWVPWTLTAACIAAYVTRGAHLSGVGSRVLVHLAPAPLYVLWKLVVPQTLPTKWARTARENSK